MEDNRITETEIEQINDHKWAILFTISLGVMVISLNMSIANVALPTISSYFNIDMNISEWIITSYLISYIGLVTLFTKIGNYKGHENIFKIGMILFLFSSISCSVAPTIELLIVSRLIQGVAASMILAGPMVIIEKTFPTNILGKAMGIYSMMVAIGLGLGPTIGGLLEALSGWRAIFLVNIPVSIIVIILCQKYLKSSKNDTIKWDKHGATTQFLSVFLIIYTLNLVESFKYSQAIMFLILTIIFVVLSYVVEKKTESPLLNINLFKNFTFITFNTGLHIIYICEYMMLYALPYYTEKILNLSSSTTGLMLSTAPLIMIIFSPLGGTMADKKGSVMPILLGAIICIISFLLMMTLNQTSTILEICIYYSILGIGISFTQAPLNKTIMSLVTINNKTSASSILTLFRSMGISLAACYASIILTLSIPAESLKSTVIRGLAVNQFMNGMNNIFIFGIICLLIFISMITYVKIKSLRYNKTIQQLARKEV